MLSNCDAQTARSACAGVRVARNIGYMRNARFASAFFGDFANKVSAMTLSRPLLLAALLTCISLSVEAAVPEPAQQPSGSPVGAADANPLDKFTRPVPNGDHSVESFYPDNARMLGQEGTVIVNFTVHTDGTLADVVVKTSSGNPSLDAAAVSAVSTWHYFPATRNGKPIEVRSAAAVQFKLRDNPQGPAPVTPFNVIEAPAFAYPPDAILNKQQGSTGMGILLDENGNIVESRVMVSSGVASLDAAATKLVTQLWHFKAATLNGKPERSSVLLIVNWTLPPSRAH